MVKVALVRPEADSVEQGLSSWAALVLTSVGGSANVSATDLRGTQVTRASVDRTVGAQYATLFFAHGQPDRIGDPTPWVDTLNIGNASGTVLVAFSCLAGDRLGPDAVAKGARAFLGFDDILTNYHPQPGLFGQVVDDALRGFLLSGKPLDDVRTKLLAGFQQIESHYLHGPGQGHSNATVIWLAAHINWRGLVLDGDRQATVP